MSVVVFLGPTLDRRIAQSLLPEATWLPPVSMGDVYAVARDRPWGIAIIDGAFDRVPAVWHKEILWAMSRGVHVFGSSSMGALRAAELETFGMIGVGAVFEAYRDRTLTDDDEVAIIHGPREMGYMAGSEAMVNIRATLMDAQADGVISPVTHDRLEALAKATHYTERTWERLWEDAAADPALRPSDVEAVRAWLPTGRRDVKAEDARELLGHLARLRATAPGLKTVEYRFHRTTFWEELRRTVARRPLVSATPGPAHPVDDAVLEEVRLTGEGYRQVRERALVRMLALEMVEREGEVPLAVGDVEGTLPLGLTRREWLRVRADDALCERLRREWAHHLPMYLRDELHSAGSFAAFEARARRKQEVLGRRGLDNPGCAEAGVTESALWTWFFEEILGHPVPPDLDAWAADHDFGDRDLMRRTALREWIYRQALPDRGADHPADAAGVLSPVALGSS